MNRNFLSTAVIAAMAALPISSFAAEDISYSYLEIDYIVQDVDMYEDDDLFDNFLEDVDDGDGFKVEGSFAFTNNLFIFANYAQTKADFTFINDVGIVVPRDTDVKTLQVGLGYFAPITYNVDFVVRAAYMDVDLDDFYLGQTEQDIGDLTDAWRDLDEDTSDGYLADAGIRAQVTPWLELGGGVRYTDLDTGDDISAFGNVLFEINQNMGINLSASFGDNLSSYGIGFRYSL